MRISQKTQQEDETEQSLSETLQTRRQVSKIHENMGHPSNRTLVRVLRLGGAKRRFILAAARHRCGACGTETSSRSNRESLAHFICVQRRCRTCPVLLKHIRKAHFGHEHRALRHWSATCYSPAGSVGRNLEERIQKQLVAVIRKASHPGRRPAAQPVLRHFR